MWAHFTKTGSGWTLRRGKALKNESAWRCFLVGLNLGQGMGFVFLDKRVSTELWLTKQFRGLVVIVMAFTLTFVLVGSAWD